MRSTAWLAIVAGLVNCVLALCAPTIMRWQIRTTLASFGAEHHADMLIAQDVIPLESLLLFHAACSFLVFVAGVLINLHRRAGLVLLIAAAAIMAGQAMLDLMDPATVPAIVLMHICWWLFVAGFALRKNRRCGAIWWRA